LLSDPFGLSDSSDDDDDDDDGDKEEVNPDIDWNRKTRKEKAMSLVQFADEEPDDEPDEGSGEKSRHPFSQAVDDMFDATMNGKQSELEEIIDALTVMEVPPEETLPPSGLVVDMVDYIGNTCLMVSCDLGHYEVASYLIKKAKCSLEVANHSGLTALHLATIAGHLDCVQVYAPFF
jgi:ankyrin repeat protein